MTKSIVSLLLTISLLFWACKKDSPKSNDITLKSFTISINNSEYSFTNIVDTFKITLPAGTSVTTAFLRSIDIPKSAISNPLIGGTISFNNGVAKIAITAEDGTAKKEYFVKINNIPFNTTQLTNLSFTINGSICSARFSNDTAYVVKPFDGQTAFTEIKINDVTLADFATCVPAKGSMVSLVNNLGSIIITAQNKITTKPYFVKVKSLPVITTYSGGTYLGMGLRDIIIADTDPVITIDSVANMVHSYTFGTKTGTKTATNGQLIITKADLGIPSDDGITFNLTTGGANLVVATFKMYEIRHWKDLQAIRFNVAGNYVLMNNIILPIPFPNYSNFNPIGTDIIKFNGSFDGRDYTISNLRYQYNTGSYIGLFSYIGTTGHVSNLKIVLFSGNEYTDYNYYLGGITGYNAGTIIRCSVSGIIKGMGIIGGIAGMSVNKISQCYTEGKDSSSNSSVGGIAGKNDGEISDCFSKSEIKNLGSSEIGGIAGENNGSIINSIATGNVTTCYNAGGIAGRNTSRIANCFALNKSINTSYCNLTSFGRIVGSNSSTLNNNKSDKNMIVLGVTHSSTDASSLDGADLDVTTITQTTFESSGWDFNTIWKWDASLNMPSLR